MWEEDDGPLTSEDPGAASVALLGSWRGGSLRVDGAS